ncbi:hypothetical protein ABW19_dt0202991 [Dactylella cylindrospora]|nr:hypothetical protein ABW19_dt0202991 [Dactylella cylindrospora]
MSGYDNRGRSNQGRNGNRGGGRKNKGTQPPVPPQNYGYDPDEYREMQLEKKKEMEQEASQGYGAVRTGGRAVRKPAHNRPPIQIGGNPEKERPDDARRFPNSQTQANYGMPVQIHMGDEEMNAHLSERLISSKRPQDNRPSYSKFNSVPRNILVEQFEKLDTKDVPGWRGLPEVPKPQELIGEEVELPINEVSQPWESVDEYLGAHYELLREDSFSPLRDAVGLYRANIHMDDTHDVCVYENSRIIGLTFSYTMGVCIKVNFSTNRARKKIRWDHSKRLCPGTLVALSSDHFKSVARVATVAARPLSALDLPTGSEVDLVLSDGDLELDPTKTWVMIESRSSYFEAYKHTLRALQRMHQGNFPLHKILTLQDKKIGAPEYLRESPDTDMTPCFSDETNPSVKQINILRHFPKKHQIQTSMDQSQLNAVERIMTKELAIVQGPPGCGKTFVSVKALAAMLKNQGTRDPPILVACQTNHALDQLLRHVIEFEPRVIRLGGRTQDQDKVKERTLYKTRKNAQSFEVQGSSFGRCRKTFKQLEHDAFNLLKIFQEGEITPEVLCEYGLITAEQRNSFDASEEQWVKAGGGVGKEEKLLSPMVVWLGEYLTPIVRKEDLMFEYEEEDISVEELKDLEAEYKDDDDFVDSLMGSYASFRRDMEVIGPVKVSHEEVKKEMAKKNVWEMETHLRPQIYRYLEKALMATLEKKIRLLNKKWAETVSDFKVARWEKDSYLLSKAKLIGMTTTGVSKYRSLVASLQPRVCLIEEAAETLEGPLIAACYPSIQQLILVGDHKQLRGHCNVRELEQDPYNLDMSMFERLVRNGVDFTMLTKQRRMRPEIRKILMPIYPELEDDVQVMNKPSVPGMGDCNLFFHAHSMPEENDEMSKKNRYEAQMVVNFCAYLVDNSMEQKDITILTFYTGQLRELYREIRRHPRLNTGMGRIRVTTVDSFQGEENEVIILSLCRSNSDNSIGFLKIDNRVCVSLSRAKRGFYIFGNARLMSNNSGLWWDVLHILNDRERTLVSTALPLTCRRHKQVTYIEHLEDWINLDSGCKRQCGEALLCGHKCTLNCHPYDHTIIKCIAKCRKILKCNHKCGELCWQTCKCDVCDRLAAMTTTDMVPASMNPSGGVSRRESSTTTADAAGEAVVRVQGPANHQTINPSSQPVAGQNSSARVLAQRIVPQVKVSKKQPGASKKDPDYTQRVPRFDGTEASVSVSPPSSSRSQPPAPVIEENLIDFDDEPVTKTATIQGNGVVTFDKNKFRGVEANSEEGKVVDLLGDIEP